MSITITIGDRVRVAAAPSAPVLTVASLYLQGAPETVWASCTWLKGAQHVHFPIAELVRDGGLAA